MKKILLVISTVEYFYSHRANLAKELLAHGYTVGLAAKITKPCTYLPNMHIFSLKHMQRKSISPWQNLLLFLELYKIYRTFNPDIVHHVGLKLVIIGSLASFLCTIKKTINALGGLGFLFTSNVDAANLSFHQYLYTLCKKPLRLLTINLLRIATFKSITVLQNPDDLEICRNLGMKKENLLMIPGVGINLIEFPVYPFPNTTTINIVCISRMLYSKGIKELVEASIILKNTGCNYSIIVYGEPDIENPDHITTHQLQQWHNLGLIIWRGYCHNVSIAYKESHIAVLPSYREGLPKSLLEAASSGRPIVTTNTPGCNLIVKDGINGFLVPIKNSNLLAEKLLILINSPKLCTRFGNASRTLVEAYFSEEVILQKFMKLYDS